MTTKHFPKGLDNRMRDQSGEIRKKRSDTKVETLRKTYGEEFAKGCSDFTKVMQLFDFAVLFIYHARCDTQK